MFLRNLNVTGFRKFSRTHGRMSMGALEGSSDTNPRELRKRGRVFTLDPNKFAETKQQRLSIGNLKSFMPNILLREKWSAPKSHLHFDSTDSTVTVAQRYPPDTRAFLYYFMSPEKPRIAGELRLRVASSDDPASFESGSDLLLLNGQPWSRPLYSLSKHYPPLYEKLREDQLVPDDLDTALSTLPSEKFSYRRSHLVYSLNDTFIVDFSTTGLDFHVVTEKGLASLPFEKPFSDYRKMCTGRPYTGSALARFERSALPDHKGTRTVVLRFLKIITPVKCVLPLYDGHICCPEEGELYRRTRYSSESAVWSVNIDKSKGALLRGLQLLWDA